MNLDLKNLPADALLPKDSVIALISQLESKYREAEEKYQEKIRYLEEKLRLFERELFGRSSEKRSAPHPNQLPLFADAANQTGDEPGSSDDDSTLVPAHRRKKRGRRPLPENLPRVDIIHDLDEEQKQCGCGAHLTYMSEEVCEKLDYIPAKLTVERHIRYKYACKNCEGVEDDGPTVKIAPLPAQLIPKSNATAGLLAHIAVAKFADGLPLYRQQKIFKRLGIDLPRATLAKWMIQAAGKCTRLIELLQEQIRSGPLINIDETPLQVLNEPGRRNTSKSYIWVFRGGPVDRPCLLYHYQPTRSGRKALEFLKNYRGYIQSDDFSGYAHLDQHRNIVRLGCWTHARRKFVKVTATRKKQRAKPDNQSLADESLDYISKLYGIEEQARRDELTPEQIYDLRQEKAKPLLGRFEKWLHAKQSSAPPKSLLGQAIHYTLSNWSLLMVYLQDGLLRPDNNLVENAIRPFAIGRKNWLFSGSPAGAVACATFFSLIETAKANGLEPYTYLRYLFKKLPLAQSESDFKKLLPQNLTPQQIAIPGVK